MKAISRTIRPCEAQVKHRSLGTVKLQISLTGEGNLSIMGSMSGYAGQILDEFDYPGRKDDSLYPPIGKDDLTFYGEWDWEKWQRLLEIWSKWHLNDMKAACPHQTGPDWDASKPVTIYHFRLKPAVSSWQRDIKERIIKDWIDRGQAPHANEDKERSKLSLPYGIKYHLPELKGILFSGVGTNAHKIPHGDLKPVQEMAVSCYAPKTPLWDGDKGFEERKSAGWTYPSEHPDGILTKKCPVCGHGYGSSWLREELPDDVVEFLQNLPKGL